MTTWHSIRMLFILLTLLLPITSFGGWFGSPGDYEECILDAMKGVTSDKAAQEIKHACKKKFPAKRIVLYTLGAYELRKITGTGKIVINDYGDNLELELYNGTSQTLNEITIRVVSVKNGEKVSRDYSSLDSTRWPFPPKTTAYFSTRILKWPKGATLEWSVISAKYSKY